MFIFGWDGMGYCNIAYSRILRLFMFHLEAIFSSLNRVGSTKALRWVDCIRWNRDAPTGDKILCNSTVPGSWAGTWVRLNMGTQFLGGMIEVTGHYPA